MLISNNLKLRSLFKIKPIVYDFKNKIANSTVECPMVIYRSVMSTLQPPTNITSDYRTGFQEDTSQSNLDMIKNQDGASRLFTANDTNQLIQVLVELDLTRLCNEYFGGSNSALKSSVKGINADVWAMASGSNGGTNTYGMQAKLWGDYWNSWAGGTNDKQTSSSSSITKLTLKNDSTANNAFATADKYITSNNKIYILIASQYTSDGTIVSSVSLDYLSISITI